MESSTHHWKFFRAGGIDQVVLRDEADLRRLGELDPKLWVALSIPTRGVEIDTRTLDYLDMDKDGRVRLPEALAAITFVEATLHDLNEVVTAGDGVKLAGIKDDKVLEAAKVVLDALGKKDAGVIVAADIDAYGKIVASLRINGDGVLPVSAVDDDDTKRIITEIMDCVGAVDDKSGEKGVDVAKIEQFFALAQAYVDWYAQGEADKALLPLGPATAAAAAAVAAVKPKIDDYFTRTRLATFDTRATALLNGADADFIALGAKELSVATPEVARLPLAHVEPGRPLPLKDGLNPGWSAAMATFVAAAFTPLLGRAGAAAMTEADFLAIQDKLAAHLAWVAGKPTALVEKLGVVRLRVILASKSKAHLEELCAEDAARDVQNKKVAEVERVILYKRDLWEILHNFVNFSRFYARKGAIFQAGTLYLDGRSCDLCMEVADPGKHGALAAMSSTYLAYCDISRPGEKKQIAGAFTGGDSDNLFVGRNGLFLDRKGRDWDATITKIIAHPISIREAFMAPYKKLARMIDEQIAKRAGIADGQTQTMLNTAATTVANADTAKAPEPKKIDVGTVAAIGVAIGGIGAMVTGILAAFFGLGLWMPLGFLAIVLIISGPAMLLAFLKLRQRNLGPVLDANGWAINGRARISVPFGRALTNVATLPKGSERTLDDPYADKGQPWWLYITLAIIVVLGLSWYFGKLDELLPGSMKSISVLGNHAPAMKAAEKAFEKKAE